MTTRGKFIVFDGIDGAGKSTQIDGAVAFFEARGEPLVVTREPGGARLGEAVRDWVLGEDGLRPETETLLMFAARCQHIQEVILPALASGKHVLSDRFVDATYAYQGAGKGVSTDDIARLERWVCGGLRPELTVIFDLNIETARARYRTRGQGDRFERENAAFFERVRRGFLDRVDAAPERYAVIDAALPPETVRETVRRRLSELFR